MDMKLRVINLWAGPGAGKSTTAAGLFHQMKLKGLSVELVTEYAKDMVWEGRKNILEDQLYITAKQNRRLHRLQGKVTWAVTDSPLLLGMHYCANDVIRDSYVALLKDIWNQYDNHNFFIQRAKKYVKTGRNQTEDEAKNVDYELLKLFLENDIKTKVIKGDHHAPETIIKALGTLINS